MSTEYSNRILISVSKNNAAKLRKMGEASESYNDVISRLLRNTEMDSVYMDLVRGVETR